MYSPISSNILNSIIAIALEAFPSSVLKWNSEYTSQLSAVFNPKVSTARFLLITGPCHFLVSIHVPKLLVLTPFPSSMTDPDACAFMCSGWKTFLSHVLLPIPLKVELIKFSDLGTASVSAETLFPTCTDPFGEASPTKPQSEWKFIFIFGLAGTEPSFFTRIVDSVEPKDTVFSTTE